MREGAGPTDTKHQDLHDTGQQGGIPEDTQWRSSIGTTDRVSEARSLYLIDNPLQWTFVSKEV